MWPDTSYPSAMLGVFSMLVRFRTINAFLTFAPCIVNGAVYTIIMVNIIEIWPQLTIWEKNQVSCSIPVTIPNLASRQTGVDRWDPGPFWRTYLTETRPNFHIEEDSVPPHQWYICNGNPSKNEVGWHEIQDFPIFKSGGIYSKNVYDIAKHLQARYIDSPEVFHYNKSDPSSLNDNGYSSALGNNIPCKVVYCFHEGVEILLCDARTSVVTAVAIKR